MQATADLQFASRSFFPRPERRGFVASAPGSALIAALVFTVIIALALAGMGTLAVSHYNLATVQAASSKALDLSEAGINWELHKLTTQGIGSADTGQTYHLASEIATGLPGIFNVSCRTLDGSALTTDTKQFAITCTGLITTTRQIRAQRTVRINAQPFSTFYTLYSTTQTYFNYEGIVVDGISGSNGTQTIAAGMSVKPRIAGLVFNGTPAPTDAQLAGYNMVSNQNPLNIQSVSDRVNADYQGGATYLKNNNNNALATRTDPENPTPVQAISYNSELQTYTLNASGYETITLHGTGNRDSSGKPIPANYYLTDINMDGHSNLVFDNSNGPINIYYLNLSGGGVHMRGGSSTTPSTDSSDNRVRMFMSASGSILINAADPTPGNANPSVEMGIYDYDTYTYNSQRYSVGAVYIGDNVNFQGQVIANEISLGTNAHITGGKGYFDTPTEYFGFSGAWRELNQAGYVGGPNQ